MATGVDVVGEVRDISLAGRGIETARLYADKGRNEENFNIVDSFLSDFARLPARRNSPRMQRSRLAQHICVTGRQPS